MFERPEGGEKAILVHLDLSVGKGSDDLDEFCTLVISAGATPVAVITGSRYAPDPRYFVGSGKAEDIRACVESEQADVVIFDHPLSPSQERNLERLVQCRVMDRTSLILDIFAQRAQSFEGKLQVELAQLRHLSTRLVRGWTHLERQKGGIGLRGPGETQLETDRRLLGERIKQISRRLEKVRRHRNQGRQARRKASIPTVSLVGYTNAGKSTLFNRFAGAHVYAADQLFATLDPTLRRVDLGDAGPAILVDTVGFIRDLPHDLVAAFRGTLEETREASLLLHVMDAHDPEQQERRDDVNAVLKEIGAEGVPQLAVYNKIDLIDAEPRLEYDAQGDIKSVWLSAASGAGVELLYEALRRFFGKNFLRCKIELPATEGKTRAQLYELNAVLDDKVTAEGAWLMEVELQRHVLERLLPQNCVIVDENQSENIQLLATTV